MFKVSQKQNHYFGDDPDLLEKINIDDGTILHKKAFAFKNSYKAKYFQHYQLKTQRHGILNIDYNAKLATAVLNTLSSGMDSNCTMYFIVVTSTSSAIKNFKHEDVLNYNQHENNVIAIPLALYIKMDFYYDFQVDENQNNIFIQNKFNEIRNFLKDPYACFYKLKIILKY